MANTTKSLTIPLDILIDVLSILLDKGIPFSVTGVDDDAQTIEIRADTDKKLEQQMQALKNIDTLTSDYQFYRHGSDGSAPPLNIFEDDEK